MSMQQKAGLAGSVTPMSMASSLMSFSPLSNRSLPSSEPTSPRGSPKSSTWDLFEARKTDSSQFEHWYVVVRSMVILVCQERQPAASAIVDKFTLAGPGRSNRIGASQ